MTFFIQMLFIHYLADFVLQTPWQAENKHNLPEALIAHTLIYSAVWMIFLKLVYGGDIKKQETHGK